jgi:CDP-diacylglycerol--glycerol-3-phosphate 3-phosphatidyltransferase
VSLANWVTLSRIPLLFFIGGLLYGSFRWAPTVAFGLYVFAGVTDWLDGYLARKYNQISDLGKLMDALNDKILNVGIFVVLISKNILPNWGVFCVLLVLCREFFITGLRIVLAKHGRILSAEKYGKLKTVLQIVVLGTFLLIEALRKDFPRLLPLGWIEGLVNICHVSFILTTLLTAGSGFHYLFKYRHEIRD